MTISIFVVTVLAVYVIYAQNPGDAGAAHTAVLVKGNKAPDLSRAVHVLEAVSYLGSLRPSPLVPLPISHHCIILDLGQGPKDSPTKLHFIFLCNEEQGSSFATPLPLLCSQLAETRQAWVWPRLSYGRRQLLSSLRERAKDFRVKIIKSD